jgi:aspartate ammonia-lyase
MLLYSASFSQEIRHKELQYGSTLMPDKSNPVLLELIRGLSMECASTATLIREYSRAGQMQLNANLPFLAEQMIRLCHSLTSALDCAAGPLMDALEPDREKMEAYLSASPALLNTLKDVLGYRQLKELLPRIKAASPSNRNALIQWLNQNTNLSKAFLQNKFNYLNLTGFTKE